MLVSLHVKNLALIEETEVNFGEGLNILSGETGAGKSIIIGSITSSNIIWNLVDSLVGVLAIINIYSIMKLKNEIKID